MARFSDRIEAIRAAAQAACPSDAFVVMSDNLSHLGNGTFAVSIKRERDEELPESEWEPGVDVFNETLASVTVRWNDDLAEVTPRLNTLLARLRLARGGR